MRARRFAFVLVLGYAVALLVGVLRLYGDPAVDLDGRYGALLNPFDEHYEWAFNLGCLAKGLVIAVAWDYWSSRDFNMRRR